MALVAVVASLLSLLYVEQEDVIESMRRENEKSTQQSLFMLRAIISLSIFL